MHLMMTMMATVVWLCVHQATKLVAALLRVVRVTAGLVKSNDSLRQDNDSRHLWADCQEPGSAPEPYAR